MKIIDFKQIRQIAQKQSPKQWMDWVDYTLRHKDDFIMPPKPRMSQSNGDYYNVMPALFMQENVAMVKMIGRHSIKRQEKRSIMMGDLMLYEADTGILKAVMDAEYITTLRTGVVAAHSAFLFGRKNFSSIGLIGLGNIMTICFFTMLNVIKKQNVHKIHVKLYRHNEQEIRFIERFKEYDFVEYELCDNYYDVIKGSEIVISAVTQADTDFAEDEYYDEGITVIPICTKGFQNCDLFFDKVFTDEIEQIKGFKYFDKFHSVANVTDVLGRRKPGRLNDKERILIYNYGIAIHDLYFAKRFYELSKVNETLYEYCDEKFFV